MPASAPAPSPLQFSDSLQCLFIPKRLKVLWGGRSAGRSWGCGRALLTKARNAKIRVLCAREFQNSIEESVHRVLKAQIERLQWDRFFDIQKNKIVGLEQGSEFLFEGIRNNTTRIKSYEGINICWIEEGAKLSKDSWNIIEPTIRGGDGADAEAEIWITLNPELESDFVYSDMIMDKDLKPVARDRFPQPVQRVWETNPGEFDGMFSVKMTWQDNPWLPRTMLASAQKLKEKDYDTYLNVWEGFPKQTLEGAVYADQLRRAREENRICTVPWERSVPVDTYWDFGKADGTGVWFVQKVALQLRILDYWHAVGQDVDDYMRMLQQRQYTYGIHVLPHDAEHKRVGMKKTIKEQFQSFYPERVRIARKIALADGINQTRILFNQMWFDESLCSDGLNALRHYCYDVKEGQRSQLPSHDPPWASCAADGLRYLAVSIRDFTSQGGAEGYIKRSAAVVDRLGHRMAELGQGLGWMGN